MYRNVNFIAGESRRTLVPVIFRIFYLSCLLMIQPLHCYAADNQADNLNTSPDPAAQSETMLDGCDCAADVTADVTCLSQSFTYFVGRYYRPTASNYPTLTASEATAIHSVGLKVVALYQYSSDYAGYFNTSAGIVDGTTAGNRARATGQPTSSPIYFCVDYNASSSDITNNIEPYFQGVAQGLNNAGFNCVIGVYGSGATCSALVGAGLASWTWKSMSTSYTDYSYSANITQNKIETVCGGLGVDTDTSSGTGAW